MATGTVKMYNSEKGFGFLVPDAGGDDLFMHIKDVNDAQQKPVEVGQRVDYEPIVGRNGKPAAGKVSRLSE
tara:strand:- start:235 stop:447 length:213 start_codon:yes stop_codon:yes gene_type:complete